MDLRVDDLGKEGDVDPRPNRYLTTSNNRDTKIYKNNEDTKWRQDSSTVKKCCHLFVLKNEYRFSYVTYLMQNRQHYITKATIHNFLK